MFVDVPRVDYDKLIKPPAEEGSSAARERILTAVELQHERFQGSQVRSNALMGPVEVWDSCKMSDDAKSLLQSAMKHLRLSARSCHRVLKVARTIADLEQTALIENHHLAEALQYRHKSAV